ncbi:unnamed protein product [Plutella xylostella]|uniref:(diamondback moth) hypothetical protein n=1 Tax=Plutella xylostella TaxID=51655 RepID=A0A8S4FRD5_PLUXY|nr:unnamed protein product [Plutella xylostella]
MERYSTALRTIALSVKIPTSTLLGNTSFLEHCCSSGTPLKPANEGKQEVGDPVPRQCSLWTTNKGKPEMRNRGSPRSQPIPDDSSGKSGAKFYQSYDRLFILKTLTSEEVERMHSFLKHYHPYIVERHGKTLLPQYLGMYRLTVDGIEHYLVATRNVFSNHLNIHKTCLQYIVERHGKTLLPQYLGMYRLTVDGIEHYLVATRNVFSNHLNIHKTCLQYIVERHGKTLLPQYLGMYRLTVDGIEHYLVATRNVFSNHLNIHKKYDLKGSTVDREASEKELEKELPTLKDNDFIKQGVRIDIGDAAKEKLLETLTADVEFLTKLHLMDYSLLLGLHECGRGEAEAEAARQAAEAESEDTDTDSDTDNRHHAER